MKRRLLVVDDEQAHCELLQMILSRNYDVEAARNAEEAIAIAREKDLDLALVDYRMPEVSGAQLLAELREIQPDCIRFLVTAYGNTDVLQEAINMGNVYRFVCKPFDPDLLRIDISRAIEHRDARKALTRSRSMVLLGQMCASVTHDMKNYLQILHIAPEILETPDAESIEFLATHLRSADLALQDMVAELLALARGETPKYHRIPAQLEDVVGAAVDLVRASGTQGNRTLSLDVAGEIPPVLISGLRCERLVHNLVKNAIDATEDDGHIRVTVSHTGKTVRLTVADNGCGMSADVRHRIFDPLFSTKGSAGVGLGLAIGRTVMEGHGGSLDCDSTPGKGTTFCATFLV